MSICCETWMRFYSILLYVGTLTGSRAKKRNRITKKKKLLLRVKEIEKISSYPNRLLQKSSRRDCRIETDNSSIYNTKPMVLKKHPRIPRNEFLSRHYYTLRHIFINLQTSWNSVQTYETNKNNPLFSPFIFSCYWQDFNINYSHNIFKGNSNSLMRLKIYLFLKIYLAYSNHRILYYWWYFISYI